MTCGDGRMSQSCSRMGHAGRRGADCRQKRFAKLQPSAGRLGAELGVLNRGSSTMDRLITAVRGRLKERQTKLEIEHTRPGSRQACLLSPKHYRQSIRPFRDDGTRFARVTAFTPKPAPREGRGKISFICKLIDAINPLSRGYSAPASLLFFPRPRRLPVRPPCSPRRPRAGFAGPVPGRREGTNATGQLIFAAGGVSPPQTAPRAHCEDCGREPAIRRRLRKNLTAQFPEPLIRLIEALT